MPVVSETRHLQLLLVLDQEGSLHAVARRLHLTPSALSQQLRELERRLGGPLFRREWRRLSPTAAARHLIDGTRGVLAQLERVESETRALLAGAQSTLRIAMICQESYRWLPDVLSRFSARAPDVDVSIVADAAHDPSEWLAARKIDLALVAGKRTRDRRIKDAHVFRDELVAVVSRRHPWASARQVSARAALDGRAGRRARRACPRARRPAWLVAAMVRRHPQRTSEPCACDIPRNLEGVCPEASRRLAGSGIMV